MSFAGVLWLAVGLAMDATAVSAARGLAAPRLRLKEVVILALAFGVFQTLMPALGWVLSMQVGSALAAWDHWIAFVLLSGIGVNMLREAGSADEDDDASAHQTLGLRLTLVLAIATSIDALAAGISLPLLGVPMLSTLATIGVVTTVMSYAGAFAGRRFGALLGKRLDLVGGLVLIGLGTKILVEHLTA